jgi:hypothetical protein
MTAMSFTGVKGRQGHLDWLPLASDSARVPESLGLYDYDQGINAIAEGMWRSRHEGHGPNLQAGVVEYFGGGSNNGPQPQGCTKQSFHHIILNRLNTHLLVPVRGRVDKRLSITGRFALLYERVCVYTGCVKAG